MIVFVSELYTGSISDKEIVIRSGFLDTLKSKVPVGEILAADAVMADKGFDIGDELDPDRWTTKSHHGNPVTASCP